MASIGLLFVFMGMILLSRRLLIIEEKDVKKERIKEYKYECLSITSTGALFLLMGLSWFYFYFKNLNDFLIEFNEFVQFYLTVFSFIGILLSALLFNREIDASYYDRRFVRIPRDLNKAKIRYKIFSVTLFLLCVSYLVYWALRSDWLRILLNK